MADKIGSKMIVMKYSAFKENIISNDLIQSIDFAFHYNQAEAIKRQSQNSKNIEADMKAMVLYFSSFFSSQPTIIRMRKYFARFTHPRRSENFSPVPNVSDRLFLI